MENLPNALNEDPSVERSGRNFVRPTFTVIDELEAEPERVGRLQKLMATLDAVDEDRLSREAGLLRSAIESAAPNTQRIIEHTEYLHVRYVAEFMGYIESGKFTREGYQKFLTQGWYYSQFTSDFERMFTEKIEREIGGVLKVDSSVGRSGNKFTRLVDEGIDEEADHELWALMDIVRLNPDAQIDEFKDVFSPTKAIVGTQHDRLSRKSVVGFLGYSFYLEYLIATKVRGIVDALCSNFSNKPIDHAFIYYHYLVDHGHSVDNIEILNSLVTSEEQCIEVLDNMNLVHAMYLEIAGQSFA